MSMKVSIKVLLPGKSDPVEIEAAPFAVIFRAPVPHSEDFFIIKTPGFSRVRYPSLEDLLGDRLYVATSGPKHLFHFLTKLGWTMIQDEMKLEREEEATTIVIPGEAAKPKGDPIVLEVEINEAGVRTRMKAAKGD